MFSSKYGVARHIYIAVPKAGSANHAVGADWTPSAGDVKVSKDGGAAANVTNLPTAIAMGNSALWDFSLTATEMQAAQIVVTVSDSATKAVDDTGFEIETYGHASAQHAFDLGTALGSQTVAAVSGAVGSVTGAVGSVTGAVGSVTGAVGSVTGNVGGNVSGSVASIAAGGIASTSFAAGAIDAAAIAADAIGASELAAGAVDEIWDEQVGDSTITARQAMKILTAALAGKLSGAATTTVTIRNVADTADVVVATVDSNGNRSATTVTV